MFREGYYLEVIKANNSAATAVITVKEKTLEIKSKKITTNKWLTLEDWSSLYEILEKALLQNNNSTKSRLAKEKKKLTRHLEITYTFEAPENPSDRTSLPTIRVIVSPSKKKKSKHKKISESNIISKKSINKDYRSKDMDDRLISGLFSAEIPPLDCNSDIIKVEEYIPDVPNTQRTADDSHHNNDEKLSSFGYVPSRKSTLEYLQQSGNSNEYVPPLLREDGAVVLGSALYVPNSIPKSDYNLCETYEPSGLTGSSRETLGAGEYIPNSKGVRKKVDEYQPDFVLGNNKSMKFDDSYVPSSSQRIKELKKDYRKLAARGKSARRSKNREESSAVEDGGKEESAQSVKRNSALTQGEIRREM